LAHCKHLLTPAVVGDRFENLIVNLLPFGRTTFMINHGLQIRQQFQPPIPVTLGDLGFQLADGSQGYGREDGQSPPPLLEHAEDEPEWPSPKF
jgi:hypothetical protein